MQNNSLQTINIENRILVIRGQQVMLDRDLAELYGVETKVLNQAVKRNIERFPQNFMFQLDEYEFKNWRSQFVTLKNLKTQEQIESQRGKHTKYLAYRTDNEQFVIFTSKLFPTFIIYTYINKLHYSLKPHKK